MQVCEYIPLIRIKFKKNYKIIILSSLITSKLPSYSHKTPFFLPSHSPPPSAPLPSISLHLLIPLLHHHMAQDMGRTPNTLAPFHIMTFPPPLPSILKSSSCLISCLSKDNGILTLLMKWKIIYIEEKYIIFEYMAANRKCDFFFFPFNFSHAFSWITIFHNFRSKMFLSFDLHNYWQYLHTTWKTKPYLMKWPCI